MLATPADAAAALLRETQPAAAAALAAIDYAPVACVASAYARADVAHALDGFGCLVPRLEQRRVLGVLFTSSMFEGRAPAGQVLLSSFIGGRRQPELAALPEADIAALAHAENAALLGARRAPLWQAVTRWPRAIPQYERGHLARVAEVAKAEAALPGLRLCANWRGGVSLGDCIVQGGRAARDVRITGKVEIHLEAEADRDQPYVRRMRGARVGIKGVNHRADVVGQHEFAKEPDDNTRDPDQHVLVCAGPRIVEVAKKVLRPYDRTRD